MSIIASLVALAVFVFRSKESRQDQKIILRRFLIWGFEKAHCNGIADELREASDLDRRKRNAEVEAQIKQSEAKIDKALDLVEKRQLKAGPKRAAVLDRQHAQIESIEAPAERVNALAKLEQDREKNAEDAADLVRKAEAAIMKAGGSVRILPESLEAIKKFIEDNGDPRSVEPSAKGGLEIVGFSVGDNPTKKKKSPTKKKSGKRKPSA